MAEDAVRSGVPEGAEEMATDDALAQLSALGEITSRAMFGGHGLYWNGTTYYEVPPDVISDDESLLS